MAGRTPKAPYLHLLNGTKSQSGKGKPGMPVDPAYLDDLTPPAHLEANAQAVWRDIAPMLRDNRILTVLDRHALEMYCVAFARWREHIEVTQDKRVMHNAETGAFSMSVHVQLAQMYGNSAERGEKKFLMNPADRSAARINPQPDLFDATPAKNGPARFFK